MLGNAEIVSLPVSPTQMHYIIQLMGQYLKSFQQWWEK